MPAKIRIGSDVIKHHNGEGWGGGLQCPREHRLQDDSLDTEKDKNGRRL